ncbi:uncharacterized protein PHACADRAFT_58702, partial [Phanerochaete carnosa HHB-10118-sp]
DIDADHEEPSDPEARLEEGDRIFILDHETYFATGTTHIRTTATDLAIKESLKHEAKTFENTVPSHYHDYSDVFSKEDFDSLPQRRPWDHAIELTSGTQPISCKVYPISVNEQKELDEFIEENLRTGRIRPSKSPWASPFFFVKKKDGRLRPVQDYRKLNELTIKNRYPLPLIQELVDKLKQARYFTKLDVRWGYNNIRIKEGDEEKAAFLTNRGLFEPLVMFFGLTNSPATFQTMMNDIFRDLISQGHVVVYLDDIMIFTQDLKEHRWITRQVLQILREHKLYLKPEKCEFEKAEIEYLGMIVGKGVVRMDPVMIEGVVNWPRPESKRDIQAFLGFTNFYRRFIRDYGKIAKPLSSLTGNATFESTVEQEVAFTSLKDALCTAPVLAIPNDNDPYQVECDASDFAIGAELAQKQDGKWKPVAYLSKAMTAAERNYEIYDKELLAIMTSLDEWRQYLMGAIHPFEIWTDHKNLEYFRKPQKLNQGQARWVTELAEYQYSLHHKPSKSNGKADGLSRQKRHNAGKEDNSDIILLKPEHFRALIRSTVFSLEGIDQDWVAEIKNTKRTKIPLQNKDKDWNEDSTGLVTWKNRIYVPVNRKLREQIIAHHHDTPLAGHPGQYKTHEMVTRNYWWPRIREDIRKYVAGCEKCQKTKVHTTRPTGLLFPNEIPSRPWEVISVDKIGVLPDSFGYNAILVVVCMYSKQIIAIPSTIELNAEGWAKALRDNVVTHHGLPRKIISDRGTEFKNQFISELYRSLGIEANPSTAYHPQTDGQTERINREIEQYLRLFINYRQADWAEWLPLATFLYNNKVHSSTGYTPFFVNKGYHPYEGIQPVREGLSKNVQQFVDRMDRVREDTSAAISLAQETMKRFYDRKRKNGPEYKEGDKVWLE